jgi:arginase family enzyme
VATRHASTRLGLIGVPSSAGAHGPGQEKVPAALRKAGLIGALRTAGLQVEDLGDLLVRQCVDAFADAMLPVAANAARR